MCALPQLREMDINPLIVDADGVVAVDARIVVAPTHPGSGQSGSHLHLAILPCPACQSHEWPLQDGQLALLRSIRPDDAEMLQALVRSLSQESRHFRFASSMPELPARMLARYTLIDCDREMALVAVVKTRHTEADSHVSDTELKRVARRAVAHDRQATGGTGPRHGAGTWRTVSARGLRQTPGQGREST